MATTKAQQIREYLKKGSFTIHEISAAHPDISKPAINTYLWRDKERGAVVRSGKRGFFKWSIAGGSEVSPEVAEQDRTGSDGGTPAGKEARELGQA